jgi:hypothetical protein
VRRDRQLHTDPADLADLRDATQIGGPTAGAQARRFELDASATWNRIHRIQQGSLVLAGQLVIVLDLQQRKGGAIQ